MTRAAHLGAMLAIGAAVALTAHQSEDVLYGLTFLGGLLLFNLMRSGRSIRSGLFPTRRRYFYVNWDVIVVRAFFSLILFAGYRHADLVLPWIASWSGWAPPAGLKIPQGHVVSALLGYFADSGLDHVSLFPKMPSWVKMAIATNVPPPPAWNGVDRRGNGGNGGVQTSALPSQFAVKGDPLPEAPKPASVPPKQGG